MPQSADPLAGSALPDAEVLRRKDFVERLMADGLSRAAIVVRAQAEFGCAPRTVDDYIRELRDDWNGTATVSRMERRIRARSRVLDIRRKAVTARSFGAAIEAEHLLMDLDGMRGTAEDDARAYEAVVPDEEISMSDMIDNTLHTLRTLTLGIRGMTAEQKEGLSKSCNHLL